MKHLLRIVNPSDVTDRLVRIRYPEIEWFRMFLETRLAPIDERFAQLVG